MDLQEEKKWQSKSTTPMLLVSHKSVLAPFVAMEKTSNNIHKWIKINTGIATLPFQFNVSE